MKMIAIKPYNDKYQLIWFCHVEDAQSAIKWCYDNWGNDWGRVHVGIPDRVGFAENIFLFHQLSHANWFKLKFEEI
jgi:hypothetical protein